MSLNSDELVVKQYLSESGFHCDSFSKSEKRAGRTPDFRVFSDGEVRFFCEVKGIAQDTWLRKRVEEVPVGVVAGGLRSDPIPSRLSTHIHDAVQQFNALNNPVARANVLAFVNHDDLCGFDDLISIVTGNFYADDGGLHPIYRSYSEGRIKEEKLRIHLFLWFEKERNPRFLFTESDEIHHRNLCAWFGIEQSAVRLIPT